MTPVKLSNTLPSEKSFLFKEPSTTKKFWSSEETSSLTKSMTTLAEQGVSVFFNPIRKGSPNQFREVAQINPVLNQTRTVKQIREKWINQLCPQIKKTKLISDIKCMEVFFKLKKENTEKMCSFPLKSCHILNDGSYYSENTIKNTFYSLKRSFFSLYHKQPSIEELELFFKEKNTTSADNFKIAESKSHAKNNSISKKRKSYSDKLLNAISETKKQRTSSSPIHQVIEIPLPSNEVPFQEIKPIDDNPVNGIPEDIIWCCMDEKPL